MNKEMNELYRKELSFMDSHLVDTFFEKREENGKTYIGSSFLFDYLLIPKTIYITYASVDEIKLLKDQLINIISDKKTEVILNEMLGFPLMPSEIRIPFLYEGDIIYIFDLNKDKNTNRVHKKIIHNVKLNEQDRLDLKYRFVKMYIL